MIVAPSSPVAPLAAAAAAPVPGATAGASGASGFAQALSAAERPTPHQPEKEPTTPVIQAAASSANSVGTRALSRTASGPVRPTAHGETREDAVAGARTTTQHAPAPAADAPNTEPASAVLALLAAMEAPPPALPVAAGEGVSHTVDPLERPIETAAPGTRPALPGLPRLAADPAQAQGGLSALPLEVAGPTGEAASDEALESPLLTPSTPGPGEAGSTAPAVTASSAVVTAGPIAAPALAVPASASASPAQVAASPGSPAFAPELGAHIRTLARQGVERAQLELHPAEMGPVTVQILVEGATAQVRLFAELAATRQALEQAMPTLAGQLREGGLTLTGGGVFDQAQQARDQGTRPGRGSTPEDQTAKVDAGTGLQPLSHRRRGVVDLVA